MRHLQKRQIKRCSELVAELNTLAKRALIFLSLVNLIVLAAIALFSTVIGFLLP